MLVGIERERSRDYRLRSKFDMTRDEYDSLLMKQGGVCAICGNEEARTHVSTGRRYDLAVDHCHSSGGIRGLLCGNCNVALGYFNDRADLVEAAINYIKEHGQC